MIEFTHEGIEMLVVANRTGAYVESIIVALPNGAGRAVFTNDTPDGFVKFKAFDRFGRDVTETFTAAHDAFDVAWHAAEANLGDRFYGQWAEQMQNLLASW